MRIFFGVGEPSGDLHGANLLAHLRQCNPDVKAVGFGGERLEAAGCRLIYRLVDLAVIGFIPVIKHLPTFFRLADQADQYFSDHRPDAVVLIDYPGFNWHIAKRAHARGIPVFYFVPPQLWAWAGWRVRKMRRSVDHVLCTLPFERQWYRDRGVAAHYVGHPYFDELAEQQLDVAFVEKHQQLPGPIVGLLPGSRNQEIEKNFSTLVDAAKRIHQARPDVRFFWACLRPSQRENVLDRLCGHALPAEVYDGRTAEIIHLSRVCLAVSGSVGLELLYREKPSVIVYQTPRMGVFAAKVLKTCRFISLVNLLADQELYPEFLQTRIDAGVVAGHLLNWLNDEGTYQKTIEELHALRDKVFQPGACRRAAEFISRQLLDGANQSSRDAA